MLVPLQRIPNYYSFDGNKNNTDIGNYYQLFLLHSTNTGMQDGPMKIYTNPSSNFKYMKVHMNFGIPDSKEVVITNIKGQFTLNNNIMEEKLDGILDYNIGIAEYNNNYYLILYNRSKNVNDKLNIYYVEKQGNNPILMKWHYTQDYNIEHFNSYKYEIDPINDSFYIDAENNDNEQYNINNLNNNTINNSNIEVQNSLINLNLNVNDDNNIQFSNNKNILEGKEKINELGNSYIDDSNIIFEDENNGKDGLNNNDSFINESKIKYSNNYEPENNQNNIHYEQEKAYDNININKIKIKDSNNYVPDNSNNNINIDENINKNEIKDENNYAKENNNNININENIKNNENLYKMNNINVNNNKNDLNTIFENIVNQTNLTELGRENKDDIFEIVYNLLNEDLIGNQEIMKLIMSYKKDNTKLHDFSKTISDYIKEAYTNISISSKGIEYIINYLSKKYK